MLSAAGSLRWLRDVVGGRRTTSWSPRPRAGRPGTEGLTFLPYLQGERTPHADPSARAMFEGLSLRHDRGALVRSVLEGVAYGLRDSLELLKALGVEPAAGRASGGGARSELWLKIVASVLGLPIERTAVEEGAAYGAALLGGVASGVFASAQEAVDACVRVRDTVEPDPDWQRVYDEGYARYRSLYPAQRSGMRRRRKENASKEEWRSSPAPAAASAPRSRGCSTTPAPRSVSRRAEGTTSASSAGSGLPATSATRTRWTLRSTATVERFGGLDIVVANAGVGAYGPFLELSREHLEEMVDTNLKGTLYAIRAALPHLLKSDAADVITLASEAGRRGLPYEAVYCASKFGQVGFTRALDHELREQGVRCTNVCPGGVATEFALDEGRGRTPDALPGMMTAEDVAEIVMFVLTRPRTHRILETAIRPMTETSWG